MGIGFRDPLPSQQVGLQILPKGSQRGVEITRRKRIQSDARPVEAIRDDRTTDDRPGSWAVPTPCFLTSKVSYQAKVALHLTFSWTGEDQGGHKVGTTVHLRQIDCYISNSNGRMIFPFGLLVRLSCRIRHYWPWSGSLQLCHWFIYSVR
jgi:hypothetical protein